MRFLLLLLVFFAGCGGGDQVELPQRDRRLGLMWLSATKERSHCEWLSIFDGVEPINLAFLYPSFGRDFECLNILCQDDREKLFRVSLSQGTCERKGNCSDLEPQSVEEIKNTYFEVESALSGCRNLTLQIVPKLEDNFTSTEACAVATELREVTDHEIHRSPVDVQSVDDSNCFDGVELHNQLTPGAQGFGYYSGSNDGKSILLQSEYEFSGLHISISATRRFRNEIGLSGHFFLWHALGNCLHRDTSSETFPNLRNCEVRPDIYHDLNQLLLRGL